VAFGDRGHRAAAPDGFAAEPEHVGAVRLHGDGGARNDGGEERERRAAKHHGRRWYPG
jgi:hypothetical protein